MIAIRLGWLLLEVIFMGFFCCFGSSAALGLAAALLLIPLCSLPINWYVRDGLQISLETKVNLRKGDTGEFSVRLTNPTIFPVLCIRCGIYIENQLNRNHQTLSVYTWILPKKEQILSIKTGSDYCGRLRISMPKTVLYDCFGICGIACKNDAVSHMTVQPDTFEIGITLIPGADSIEESDVYSEERSGMDLTETFQIREYVPGDSPRQIHWKLSNKFDRLIVREPALPITRNVLVFWERTGESGDPERIDAQAEVVVSVCKSLLDHSIRFTIGWNDTDRNLCILHEIQDMDELVGIIPRLMRAAGAGTGMSGAELLLQTGGHALCSHMVYLAEAAQPGYAELGRYGHVRLLLGGTTPVEGAVMFDPEHVKEQLSQIDL